MDDERRGIYDEENEITYGSVTAWLVEKTEESLAGIEAMLAGPDVGSAASKLRKLADQDRAFLKKQKAAQAYLAENPDIANQRIE